MIFFIRIGIFIFRASSRLFKFFDLQGISLARQAKSKLKSAHSLFSIKNKRAKRGKERGEMHKARRMKTIFPQKNILIAPFAALCSHTLSFLILIMQKREWIKVRKISN